MSSFRIIPSEFGYFLRLLLLLLALPWEILNVEYSSRLVETTYGTIRGILIPRSGILPRDVEGFLGIPYASAPAASLRFMPPLTPSHWEGVRNAETFAPVCPQLVPDTVNLSHVPPLLKYTRLMRMSSRLSNQSEDCLHLNIFAPVQDERGRAAGGDDRRNFPIVVLLHGDSWEWGSGNLIEGSAFASQGNVMVITLNYRLGIFGFLQTSNQQGNFAIMDVVAALNWVRENAEAFGGDVSRVTLMGHRTGAVLANFLMLAPVAKDLFHRVILLSGSALSPWSFQRQAKMNVRKLSQVLGCPQGENKGPVHPRPGSPKPEERDYGSCFRGLAVEELLGSMGNLLHPRFISRFGPLVDNAVLKDNFVSEMRGDGTFRKMPLLLGTASIESFGELNSEDIEDGMVEGKRDRILRTFVRNVFVYHLNEIYSTIKNEYTDWEKPRRDLIDVRDSILHILSDGLTIAPLVQVASLHAGRNSRDAKTFFFHFQHEPDHSVYPHRIGSISEDLLEFSVGQSLGDRGPGLDSLSAKDARVSKGLLHYLTNFIFSGDPNNGYDGSSVEAQLPFWDSYDPINQLYMEIGGEEFRMRSHFRGHKMALWLNLIPQLQQSGGPDVTMLHHNFREEKPDFYEGIVREQQSILDVKEESIPSAYPFQNGNFDGSSSSSSENGTSEEYDREPHSLRPTKNERPTSAPGTITTSECPPNSTISPKGGDKVGEVEATTDLARHLAASHYHSYGTALGVTIGVGCCLLLLNLLIFLAIYHQKSATTSVRLADNFPKRNEGEESSTLCRLHDADHDGRLISFEEFDEDVIEGVRECKLLQRSYLPKEFSSSSGFSSPPIPEPPPPPRSIPPSLLGSMASIASSNSAGPGGILRRPLERADSYGSKKSVQIQEISV